MVAASILITGANRGIGLAFVKRLLTRGGRKPTHIFGTYRDADRSEELLALAADNSAVLHTVCMDVTDDRSVIGAAELVSEIVGSAGLNVLINNAGSSLGERFVTLAQVERADLLRMFDVNAISPCMVAKYFAGLLERAAKISDAPKTSMGVQKAAIVNIGSVIGSVARTGEATRTMSRYYGYRPSKCALNMMNRNLAYELEDVGILCVCVHPGWVLTDMGGQSALTSAEESTEAMLKTMSTLTEINTGSFIDWTGKVLPF